MGDSNPATYGRFKPSHQFQGFAFPFSLYPPSFPVQSIRNRLGFLFPPEARASRRHSIPADDRSPGCESHPDHLKPPPRQGPPSRGALWLFLNPRARLVRDPIDLEDDHCAGSLFLPATILALWLPDLPELGVETALEGRRGHSPGGLRALVGPAAPAGAFLQRAATPN